MAPPDDQASAEPYQIGDNVDIGKLIRTVAYPPPIMRHMVIERQDIPGPRPDYRYRAGPPTADAGSLSQLPVEVLQMILGHLDMASLINFSRTGRFARHFVQDLPAYQRILKHARAAFLAVLATGLAPHIGLTQLDTALRTEKCICGRFAPTLFLPTVTKCCLRCLSDVDNMVFNVVKEGPDYEPELFPAPRMHSLVGIYAPTIYNSILYTPDPSLPERMYLQATAGGIADISDAWWLTRGGADLSLRFAATVVMPYLRMRHGETPVVEHGVRCKVTCQDPAMLAVSAASDYHWAWGQPMYSTEAFLEHFTHCEAAQRSWEWERERQGRI
ncbi:hypothetical protein OQA88_8769 [Cercophora sp. LCS_1]